MANKKLFSTKGAGVALVDTKNAAGGRAYAFGDEHTLAQGIVTSTFGKTFYMSEAEQLDTILGLAQTCSAEFVAKAAVYGHEVAKMKDTPALMLAVLLARGQTKLVEQIAPRILTRFKMLQNFMQIVRSNKTGRRSFGTVGKRIVQEWFESRTGNALFTGSIGSDPSMADAIKMAHPKPESSEKKALYAYFIGRKYDQEALPPKAAEYESFKAALAAGLEPASVPGIPFQMLASLPLTEKHWKSIVLQMPWNALRMNLNTAARHGAFKDNDVVAAVAAKLADPSEVRRNNAFPYQLLTSFQNIGDDVPMKVRNALQDAMEVATENVPVFDGGVAICVDTSGSMSHGSITGSRPGSTSKTRPIDVAALVGASIARKNGEAILVPFDTTVHATHGINPRDSVMTNAARLASFGGGGTDCACAMRLLNSLAANRPKVVIYVSDNESWYRDSSFGYSRGTGMAHEWDAYRRRVPGARLILIDLVANATTQVQDGRDTMNIGGFSDKVWPAIERFVKNGDTDFVRFIRETISLEAPVTETPAVEVESDEVAE